MISYQPVKAQPLGLPRSSLTRRTLTLQSLLELLTIFLGMLCLSNVLYIDKVLCTPHKQLEST